MKLRRLDTTAEIIDACGGNTPVGEMTDSNPKAVSNWRAWQSLPPKTYVVLDRELRVRGFYAPPSLWGMAGVEATQ